MAWKSIGCCIYIYFWWLRPNRSNNIIIIIHILFQSDWSVVLVIKSSRLKVVSEPPPRKVRCQLKLRLRGPRRIKLVNQSGCVVIILRIHMPDRIFTRLSEAGLYLYSILQTASVLPTWPKSQVPANGGLAPRAASGDVSRRCMREVQRPVIWFKQCSWVMTLVL